MFETNFKLLFLNKKYDDISMPWSYKLNLWTFILLSVCMCESRVLIQLLFLWQSICQVFCNDEDKDADGAHLEKLVQIMTVFLKQFARSKAYAD